MRVFPALLTIFVLMLIGGCQSSWVRLDNARIDEAELRKAELACNVAQKLEALEQAKAHRNVMLAKSNTNESKMLLKDDYAIEAQSIYAEIEACMRQQGLKKAD